MRSYWLNKPQTYDGTQLRSRWVQEMTNMEGDAIVAFQGGTNVPIENMVDLEDVARGAPIFSEEMLHFIVEIFDKDLEKMVLRQRLLVAIIKEELKKYPLSQNIRREGDDLYDRGAKLSVSIATHSPSSCLIHTGLNISNKNTPVLTKGLKDYDIDPKNLAQTVMKNFCLELEGIRHAKTKVRSVP